VIADTRSNTAHRRSPLIDWSRRLAVFAVLALAWPTPGFAQAPVSYRVSFPAPEHHWMQVEVTFPDVPAGSLHVIMSRTSPGRYAIHEFAKNVYDVRFDDGAGRPLTVVQSNPSEWTVSGHAATVRVSYRLFGDRTDGTFLGIDPTHAHINMPAAFMWALGMETRPVRVTFQVPPSLRWRVATQLHSTSDPATFTAANLAYLMDSPTELSDFALRTFRVGQMTFRLAVHHDGTDSDVDRLAGDAARIVKEEAAVYGELPAYEGGIYTFIGDYLPYATRDGMEHRNSTFMTSAGALRVPAERAEILETISHEFFHGWNVERIRPRSLEPFDLREANMSGELWLAEGFTNYYGILALQRAGLATLEQTAASWARALDGVIRSPGRKYRTAEEMSRMAPFVDAAASGDRTNLENTFISYYTWGEAIALGLDLTLRERSSGRVTLDDYMRALWIKYGKPGGSAEGVVDRPYTMADARACLAEVSADPVFADQFFSRYIQGRDVVDYQALLASAGMLLRQQSPGRAWIGPLPISFSRGNARVAASTIEGSPVYVAGIDRDDEIVSIDGEEIKAMDRLDDIVQRHKPGDRVPARIRRRGTLLDVVITAQEDPRLELVPLESRRPLTSSERSLRNAWLNSRQ
jgi:predicted metalloprotease with PDZ domain